MNESLTSRNTKLTFHKEKSALNCNYHVVSQTVLLSIRGASRREILALSVALTWPRSFTSMHIVSLTLPEFLSNLYFLALTRSCPVP